MAVQVMIVVGWAWGAAACAQVVGPSTEGAILPSGQEVMPAGRTAEYAGRPVDLVVSRDGAQIIAKDDHGLVVVDAESWAVVQQVRLPKGGGSVHGIARGAGGSVWFTDSASSLREATRGEDGQWTLARVIEMPAPGLGGVAFPCGVAVSEDGATAWVCLSRGNALAVVDLARGEVSATVDVGVAPYGVVVHEGRAWVSNWGGRRPGEGERSAASAGTPTLVDERGIASSGSVSVVDLASRRVVGEVAVGLHPSGLAVSPDGAHVLVACANSDTVVAVRASDLGIDAVIDAKPDAALPFGSAPNALAFDGTTLYVANARNNALAVFDCSGGLGRARLEGLIPTGAYPGAVAVRRDGAGRATIVTANLRGVGARTREPEDKGWHATKARGSLGAIVTPTGDELAAMTERARRGARLTEASRAAQRGDSDAPPVPVPAKAGQRSVFEHVVYIIKENRTYDQVFGDMGRGNSEPSLCVFGREITPNHHALADEFVLLDNFYCNGVLSTDGHAWACEGDAVGYIEKQFGGFARNYNYAEDPLGMASSGAIWDHALAAGLSLRNFGEVDYPIRQKGTSFADWLKDLESGERRLTFEQKVPLPHLRRYTSPAYPGWEMEIPDVVRADAFVREVAAWEAAGAMPALVIVYLPNDHTSGLSAGKPSPRAYLADNDLALGRVVDVISRSRFWGTTCVFSVEDDPQDGWDHVDGHRSICLVASPYTRRGAIVSEFYNQASVLHTMERMLGIPAANMNYAMAPVMSACFGEAPDARPFVARPAGVPLTETNPRKVSLRGEDLRWAEVSEALELLRPDAADEDTLNRVLWRAMRGDELYPAAWAGAHGRGLARLGLKLRDNAVADDDDDERDRP